MNSSRRPVSSRNVSVFHRLAQSLVRLGVHPNQVSVASAGFGILAGASLYVASPAVSGTVFSSVAFLLLALVGIQLRLICNLIDGLMAIEGGMKTATGELYNDLPDRVSDLAIFVGAGYSASIAFPWAAHLGWAAAVAAILTAYVRVLGASMKAPQFFSGPMAKQHRMFLMNVAVLGTVVEVCVGRWGGSLVAALFVVALGSLWTCGRRLRQISKALGI